MSPEKSEQKSLLGKTPEVKSPRELDEKILSESRRLAPEKKSGLFSGWMPMVATVSVVALAVVVARPVLQTVEQEKMVQEVPRPVSEPLKQDEIEPEMKVQEGEDLELKVFKDEPEVVEASRLESVLPELSTIQGEVDSASDATTTASSLSAETDQEEAQAASEATAPDPNLPSAADREVLQDTNTSPEAVPNLSSSKAVDEDEISAEEIPVESVEGTAVAEEDTLVEEQAGSVVTVEEIVVEKADEPVVIIQERQIGESENTDQTRLKKKEEEVSKTTEPASSAPARPLDSYQEQIKEIIELVQDGELEEAKDKLEDLRKICPECDLPEDPARLNAPN